LRPYWPVTLAAYLAVLVITGLSILIPQLIRFIVDQGIRAADLRLITWAVLGFLALALLKAFITFLQGRWIEIASQNVAYDLRNDIQNKLTDLSFSYHDKADTGQLLSRAVQDVERIRFLTGRATWRLVDGVVLLLVTAAVLFWMNAGLALLTLLTAPLLIHRGYQFGRIIRPLSAQLQDQLGVLTSRVEQNLRGARVVRAFAQEDAELDRFTTDNERWFGLSAIAARLEAINPPVMDLIINGGVVAILWYGGTLVINGSLTLGELVAFTTYLGQLSSPVRMLGRVIPALAIASAAADRIFAILDTVPEVQDSPGAITLPALQGHVRFENVSSAYGRRTVIRDINFEVEPGQIVALLGATGSGKSTLINLIPRFYDPTAGRILIDGHDVRCLQLAWLRHQIGIVLQETTLFATTIRDNITFGRPDAPEAELIAAAQAAQAHDFILQTPQGYDTYVGERGTRLSGGQKQRLAIARALLTGPRILILDDATASVDTETERLIQDALDRLMVGRTGTTPAGTAPTTFVIAHRLSTVRRADLILLLDKGRIVERGKHEDLLKRSRLYRQIYERQLRRDSSG
jgi:ATP-binding cassette subfamily B protein